jgi:plasmid stability protein
VDTILIEALDPIVERKLRQRAAEHGLSVSQEAERILAEALVGAPITVSKPVPLTEEEKEARVQRLLSYARRPVQPIDWKAESDAMWDFLE